MTFHYISKFHANMKPSVPNRSGDIRAPSRSQFWSRHVAAFFLLGIILLFGITRTSSSGEHPASLPAIPIINPSDIVTLLPADTIPAINNPKFEDAGQTFTHLKANERVIGVIINGDARAYPINILSSHEIVNDVVGGEPVAVTWCPLCYSAMVFSRICQRGGEALNVWRIRKTSPQFAGHVRSGEW